MARKSTSKTPRPRSITCVLTKKGNKAVVTVPPGVTAFKDGDILHFHCDKHHKVQVLLKHEMYAHLQVQRMAEPANSIIVDLRGDTFVVNLMRFAIDDGGPDTGGDG